MKRVTKLFLTTLALTAAMAISSFADTRIGSVNIKAEPDDDASLESGECIDPYFSTDNWNCSISGVEDVDSNSSPSKTHTYEITIDANDGYYFSSNISVSYSGITEVTKKKTEDDGATLILRVESYPYYMYPAPMNLKLDEGRERVTWDDVEYADRYEYVIDWTDKNGDDRTKHGTVSKTLIDVSAYLKEYNDSDYEDCEIQGIAVRATGDAGSNPRTVDGEWAKEGNVDISDYEDDYEDWSDAVGNAGNTSGSSSGGQSNNLNNGQWVQDISGRWHWNTLNGYATGWINDGTAWYYCDSEGTMLTGWVNDGTAWYYCDGSGRMLTGWVNDGTNWYYCDGSGRMLSGWINDGSNWYYQNPVSNDTPYGAMLTGWRMIDGNTFFLNTGVNTSLPYGAMLTGAQVIDGVGYYFNESHDGTYGKLIIG